MSDAKKVLEVEFSATDRISEVIGKINKNLQGMEAELTTIATFAGVSFAALAAGIGLASREAIQAEDSLNKAGSAVKVAGQNWDLYREQVQGVTASLQEHTRFSDDDLQRAFAQVVNITGDAGRSLDNLSLITDVATARNIDLGTAADAVSKAMQGNIGRLGVLFPELQRNIEALGDTATDSQRAGVAIGYLSGKFKGLAEEDAKSLAGQLTILKNQFNELQEAIGGAFLSQISGGAEGLLEIIKNTTEWVQENQSLIAILGTLGLAITGTIAGLALLGLAIPKVVLGFEALGIAILHVRIAMLSIPGWGWAIAGATAIVGLTAAISSLTDETHQAELGIKDLRDSVVQNADALFVSGVISKEALAQLKEWGSQANATIPGVSDYTQKVIEHTNAKKILSDQDKIWIAQIKEAHEALLQLRFDETPNLVEIVDNNSVLNPMQGLKKSLNKQLDITPAMQEAMARAIELRNTLASIGVGFANSFSSNLSRVFGQIRSLADLSALKIKDVFMALGDTIIDMLAQIAARMAVFGLLSLIPGGGALLGGLGSFVFGGGGGTNSVGGGNTIPAIVPQNNFSGGGSAGNTYNIQIGRFIGNQENARELGLEIRRLERYGQLS